MLEIEIPRAIDGSLQIADVASLEGAGPEHVAFCATKAGLKALAASHAGYCLVDKGLGAEAPDGMVLLPVASAQAAFARVASALYPDHGLPVWDQEEAVAASAILGGGVRVAQGAVIGPRAEIGDGSRIGPHAVIGPGVALGRNCEIGSNVTITHAYLGDAVIILPGAQIGQPGFGFISGPGGHAKMPQLGRVIVQDRVEIGACTTVDRGALGDTVIGEGTKIDNLVQIAHNCRIGRNCIIVAQVGMSGSCELGDFVVLGGQAGLADHAKIGDGARLAARAAAAPGELAGGQDYGGVPAVPAREWRRQVAAVAMLGRRKRNAGV